MKRSTKSRLRKFLRACNQLGRYPAVGSLALTLGCMPDPSFLAVSPDGRHIAVPVDAKGQVALGQDAMNGDAASRCVLIDLKTNTVRVLDRPLTQAMWLSCAEGGRVAVMAGHSDDDSVVIVQGDGPEVVVKDAGLPVLSPSGDKLAYMLSGKENPDDPELSLRVRDLKTGTDTLIAPMGTTGVFSPDGATLAFVALEEKEEKKETAGLYVVSPPDGKPRKLVGLQCNEAEGAPGSHLIMPFWLDAKHIVYATRTEQTGDDSELFVTDLEGKTEQLTDNDFFETQPGVTADGRLVYIKTEKVAYDHDRPAAGHLWVARKTDKGWEHKDTGLRATYFKVTGKQVACLDVEQAEGKVTGTKLFTADLDTGKVVRDLGQMIQQQAGKALAAPAAATQPAKP